MDRQDYVGGGGMTGATGDLVPDDHPGTFDPGERREAEDSAHHADVTSTQGRRAPAQHGDAGDPGHSLPTGGPTNMASRDDGYGSEQGLSPDDPAYRMERHADPARSAEPSHPRTNDIGGDELLEGEPRF